MTELTYTFAWDQLPFVHLGVDAHRTRTLTEDWTITLPDGREIDLNNFHQFKTYEGVLAGLPVHPYYNEQELSAGIRKATHVLKLDGQKIWIMPPTIQRVTVINRPCAELERRTGHRQPERQEVDFLPPVCSIGLFSSQRFAPEKYVARTEAVAIWYQVAFGIPGSDIVEKLKEFSWEEYCAEFSY